MAARTATRARQGAADGAPPAPRKRRARVRATALAPELTIREAGELQQRLLALLDGGGAVRLDASGVTLIDTAGLQLLAALATGLRVEGRELQWAKVSDTLRDAAQRTGLSQPLGIDG